MIKKFAILLTALLVSGAIVSCDEENKKDPEQPEQPQQPDQPDQPEEPDQPEQPAEIILKDESDHNLQFDGEKQSRTIAFTASDNWKAKAQAETSGWINVSPTTGTAGEGTFEITVQPNETGSTRTAVVLITSAEAKEEISVSQTSKAAEDIVNIDIPDAAFKAYLTKSFDANKDGEISTTEAANITKIIVSEMGITSLKGIEYMPALFSLECNNNSIKELDLSGNPALVELYCSVNGLEKLNIDNCSQLRGLYVNYNNLTELNLPEECNVLFEILAIQNQLTTVDLSRAVKLKEADFENNKLQTIDFSHNPEIMDINLYKNQLTSLTLGECFHLDYLECSTNQLTSLDVSLCPKLQTLSCEENKFTELNLKNNFDLRYISFATNEIADIDLSSCKNLSQIYCSWNNLTSLDLTANEKLQYLDCSNNQLTDLNISNSMYLEDLECSNNVLPTLDLSGNLGIINVTCNYNQLTGINTTGCQYLTNLECEDNRLTELDISGCPEFEYLNALSNPDLKTIWVWEGFNIDDYYFDLEDGVEFKVK